MINGIKYIKDMHTLELIRIGKEYKQEDSMIKERDITENNYNYYLMYRELGYKTVNIKGFKHLPEMLKFISDSGESIVVLERLVTFK